MKKRVLSLVLLSVISSAFAGGPEPVNPVANYSGFNGFTLGIAGAYYHTVFNEDVKDVNNSIVSGQLKSDDPYFHGQLGYGHAFSRFYLGLNIFADVGQAQVDGPISGIVNNVPSTLTIAATLRNVYGGVLKPGFVVSPQLLLYAIGGGVVGQQLNNVGAMGIIDGYNGGWIAGGGAEYLITPYLSVDAEGAYLKFNEANNIIINDIFGGRGPVSSQKINVTRFLLGLNLYI